MAIALSSVSLPARSLLPPPLRHGDKIAIVTPATTADVNTLDHARQIIREYGYEPVVMPHALDGRYGTFGGTDKHRVSDLAAALNDTTYKAVICSRGGYGVVHLLEGLEDSVQGLPLKWVVGFSDITALHAFMQSRGVASIHGPMCVTLGSDAGCTRRLMDLLAGQRDPLSFASHRYNRRGHASGRLTGGNIAVWSHLMDTPYAMVKPGDILFIEEVEEPAYKIQRVLYQLRLSGVLERLGGLVVGQMSKCHGGVDFSSVYDMIRDMVAPYDFPVAFDAPIGHVRVNQPVISGAGVTLDVSGEGAVITYDE